MIGTVGGVRTSARGLDRPVWSGEPESSLRCTAVEDVTHDVRTFLLEPPEPSVFEFDAGQYLTVTLEVAGEQVSRCYSISSPPTRPNQVAITVKRVPGGVVSNWLHDHMRPGRTLRATGPLGRFTMVEHPASKYLLLSGGSGITPLMSMVRTLRDTGAPADVVLVHNARSPADIIFRSELTVIDATARGVRVVPVCEEDSPGEQWAGLRGRLSLPMLRRVAPDLHEREVLVCGPGPYMAAVRGMLHDAGADLARHHEESFDFGAEPGDTQPPPAAPGAVEARVFTVEFARSGRTIECDADTHILEAAARAAVNLPSSCGQGVCGTCKSTLLEGTVDMQHGGGIRPREVAQGKILVCCSKPTANLVIDA